MLVSFHLSRRLCVAILRLNPESPCWRAKATLQVAAVMSVQLVLYCFVKSIDLRVMHRWKCFNF